MLYRTGTSMPGGKRTCFSWRVYYKFCLKLNLLSWSGPRALSVCGRKPQTYVDGLQHTPSNPCRPPVKNLHKIQAKVKSLKIVRFWGPWVCMVCMIKSPWRHAYWHGNLDLQICDLSSLSLFFLLFLSAPVGASIMQSPQINCKSTCDARLISTVRSDVKERFAEERTAWDDKNVPAWPKNISVF